MPGHTHTQPAQPTTLGHFLAATAEALERDAVRVQAAFARTNRGPLGAAALTTTGFPIDRELTARLLGFDDVVTNSYDAIGGVDYALESLAALTTCVLGLARLIHELLLWATREYGVLRIDDSFIQISSIMPQKRNPVVLEHLRARVGWVLGSAATAQTLVHGGGVRRHRGRGGRVVRAAVPDLRARHRLLRLADAALATCQFDREKLAARATDGFTTATEIADTLVRHAGPLVQAGPPGRLDDRSPLGRRAGGRHHRARRRGGPRGARAGARRDGPAHHRAASGRARSVGVRALPHYPRGPAPEAVRAHVAQMRETMRRDVAWRERREQQIADAVADRHARAAALG